MQRSQSQRRQLSRKAEPPICCFAANVRKSPFLEV